MEEPILMKSPGFQPLSEPLEGWVGEKRTEQLPPCTPGADCMVMRFHTHRGIKVAIGPGFYPLRASLQPGRGVGA